MATKRKLSELEETRAYLEETNASLYMANASLKKKLQTMEEKLRDRLECPVCLQVPRSGPFYECKNGHIVCKDCATNQCPLCKLGMGPRKSLVAETIIEIIPHYCKFDGCGQKFSGDVLEGHEKVCPHRTVACPNPHCFSQVPLSSLVDHTQLSCASSHVHSGEYFSARLNETGPSTGDVSYIAQHPKHNSSEVVL